MAKLADARRSIVRAKEAAQERLLQIESERREIKVTIKSLDAALKALDGPKTDRKQSNANKSPALPSNDGNQ